MTEPTIIYAIEEYDADYDDRRGRWRTVSDGFHRSKQSLQTLVDAHNEELWAKKEKDHNDEEAWKLQTYKEAKALFDAGLRKNKPAQLKPDIFDRDKYKWTLDGLWDIEEFELYEA